MEQTNRLIKYLRDEQVPQAKCVVVSDLNNCVTFISYDGEKLVWSWNRGLICPGSEVPFEIHPLSAEALVTEEVMSFLRLEGLEDNDIIYVNSAGEKLSGIVFNPPELGEMVYDIALKKLKIKELYEKFVLDGDRISEEMIGESISLGVLGPFLSLVNL